jgi:hypothetical protein
MTAYYFAARYSRHPEMRDYRDQLTSAVPGAIVTSRWIDCHGGDFDQSFTPDFLAAHPEECWTNGQHDLEDLSKADAIVSFTETGYEGGRPSKGGRHIEHGHAIAEGMRLVIVGPRENIFHCHPATEVYEAWVEFLGHESLAVHHPSLLP